MSVSTYRNFLLAILFTNSVFASVGERGIKIQDYFVADSTDEINVDQWTANLLSVNADNVLDKTNIILEKHPGYLKAHLLKGLIYFHRLGKITNAVNEFYYIDQVAEKLSSNFELSDEYDKQITNITKQTQRQLNQINREFGNLRVSIKDVDIDRYCYIKNLDIAITISEEVMSKVNYRQKLRFSELEENLRSGKMKLKFSTYDSTDNKYYFEIPYFPLVDINSNELPYSMIINNSKRYHFILDRQNNEKLEIDWNNEWKLVETVPDKSIKLEFPSEFDPHVVTSSDIQVTKAYSIPDQNSNLNNLYIDTSNNDNLQLVVSTKGPTNLIEKYLYYSNKAIIALGIIIIVIIIR